MPPSLFLALTYLKPKRSMLSAINLLAVLGTLIGVAVLVIVISVMTGFDAMWREKILSFHPHVTAYSFTDPLSEDDPLFDKIRAMDGVVAVSPLLQNIVVAQNGEEIAAPMLRGLDPEHDFLFRKMVENPKHLIAGTFALDEDECLIGVDLATKLRVDVGDRLSIYSPMTFAREKEIMLPEDVTIVGIFSIGMWQIDQGYVITDLDTARDIIGLRPGEPSDVLHGMMIMGTDLMLADSLETQVQEASDGRLHTLSWMRMDQALFNALWVEKRMMFLLLGVISIVASFLVSSTLIMMSVQKTKEIGLLKALGFPSATVMAAFMWYGLIQGVLGIVSGISAGLLLLKYRDPIMDAAMRVTQRNLMDKELYFLSELPSRTNVEDVLMVVALVLALCLVVGAIPAWLAARKDPVQALRHD